MTISRVNVLYLLVARVMCMACALHEITHACTVYSKHTRASACVGSTIIRVFRCIIVSAIQYIFFKRISTGDKVYVRGQCIRAIFRIIVAHGFMIAAATRHPAQASCVNRTELLAAQGRRLIHNYLCLSAVLFPQLEMCACT